MDNPVEKSFDNTPDYVPLSIKIIIGWFYVLSLLSFFNTISFESGRFKFFATSFVYGCLVLITAYGLGSRRNASRLMAIILAGLWFLPYLLMSWQTLEFWLETNRIVEFSFRYMGKEFPKNVAIFSMILPAIIQINTIVILLQPRIRNLFTKPTRLESAE